MIGQDMEAIWRDEHQIRGRVGRTCCRFPEANTATIPAIAKAAKNAVVTIVMEDNDKPIALGTGFLVSADGAVLTNYPVIANGIKPPRLLR